MTQVIPAIIPHTKEQLENEIKLVSDFAELVQVDITDGDFVPTRTWPYNDRDIEFWEKLKNEESGWPMWDSVEIELHLMVRNPENVVSDWIKTGIASLVFHIEATENPEKIIDICRENSVSVGVAIKPSTPISLLEKVITKVDFVQVMGSDLLGKHGVLLEDNAIELIKKLRHTYGDIIIAIDIGVSSDTKDVLVSAGANKLIVGGAILNSDNPKVAYQSLVD